MAFEWQTGDDEGAEWREERPPNRYRSPRWRWLLLGLVALIAAGSITWRLAERRVEASSERMRADIRTSHELVRRAAAGSDVELLRTVLSGRDDDWTETQRRLLQDGYGYTSAARLLFLEPVGEPEERSLTLDPSLRTAELVLAQQVTPTAASTVTGPVVLEQTYTYRRGSNRWLLSPPEDDFWGVQRSTRAGRVVVKYPERDEALAERLVGDLDADVEKLCELQGGRCPADLVVTVTLEPEPESLLAFSDGGLMLSGGVMVSLPAPSLLGIPRDGGAYKALHDAYARYLLSALAPGLTQWECCEQVLFWQALLQAQLHDIGLAPPLLSSADSMTALELVSDVERFFVDLSNKWQLRRPVGLHTPLPLDVRVLVAFLLDQDQTAQNVQLSLNQPTAFHLWWSSFTSFAPTDRRAVRPDLISFVQAQYEPPPLPAGLSLPTDDLLLACGEMAQSVWRYDLAAETWTEELALDEGQFATVVTGEDRYFITSLQFGEEDAGESMRLSVWRVEPGEPPARMGGDTSAYWLPLAKHGPVVPAAFFDYSEPHELDFGTVDLRACGDGGCPYDEAPGYVIPSPGGENELATRALFDSPGLYLRPRGGEWKELPQQGASPFWIDDQTFAYLESRPDASSEPVLSPNFRLVVQTLDNESAVLVEARQPGQDGESDLFLHSLGGFYHAPADTIYLLATDQNQRTAALLSVARPPGGTWLSPEPVKPQVVALAEGTPSYSAIMPLTSQGRWLVVTMNQPRARYPGLWLVDLAGELPPWTTSMAPDSWLLPGYDWSPDGQWLAWLVEGAVHLAAPTSRDATGEPYQLLIPHDQPRCSSLAWLQR